jgi:hypothetical protein
MSAQNFLTDEVLQKVSEAWRLQVRHESEKRRWSWLRRLIHCLERCPICRPERSRGLDRWK